MLGPTAERVIAGRRGAILYSTSAAFGREEGRLREESPGSNKQGTG